MGGWNMLSIQMDIKEVDHAARVAVLYEGQKTNFLTNFGGK